MRALIVGCGYIGSALAEKLAGEGHDVFGLRRNLPETQQLQPGGWKPLAGDISRRADLDRLPRGWDWVINCVSSSLGGPDQYRETYLEGMRNLLDWLGPNPPRKFVYTSSTSVYGQTDGSNVDESSPTLPGAETGQILLETEQALRDSCRAQAFPGVILRLAGIYGPGRGYWFKQFLNGQADLEGGGERILNMIHRDDVVGAIQMVLANGMPGEIYNGADDEPVSQKDLFRWLAARLGRELPAAAGSTQVTGKRGPTNKRVLNHKLRSLGYEFAYPTFREGYRAEMIRLGLETV